MSTEFQYHHLIPNQIKEHSVLKALRASDIGYDQDLEARNLLLLPNKSAAASTMEVALAVDSDAAHTGPHGAYTKMVRELLDGIRDEFLDPNNNLLSGKTFEALDDEVNKLQFFLADGLTASFDGERSQGPKFILNNADPRSPGAFSEDEYYDLLFKDYSNYNEIKNHDAFKHGLDLRQHVDFNWLPENFDDGASGRSGLWSVVQKIEGAKKAGLDSYDGINISGLNLDDLTILKGTTSGSKLDLLKTIYAAFAANESGSVPVGGKFFGVSDKLGALDAAMIGGLALGIYQIADESGLTVQEVLDYIELNITEEFLADAAAGVAYMAFEHATLSMLTGGVGTVARLSIEASDSAELIQLTTQVLDIAYPEWELMASISAASAQIEAIANKALSYVASGLGFSQMLIADTTDAEPDTGGTLAAEGGAEADLIWARGENAITAEGGEGNDWIFHTGNGEVISGIGDDFVFARNLVESDDGQTYEEERQEMLVDAGSGDDTVLSLGAAEIHLGAGKDTLLWSGAGSVVYTGPGGEDDADSLYFTRGSLIADADGYDTAYAYGILSAAGSYYRFAGSEDPYAYKNLGLLKVGFNSDGELVLGDLLSEEGKEETFTYFANGNNNPTANTADLTAGIRVAEIEIYVYQIFDDIPEGLSDQAVADMWEFIRATIKELDGNEYVGGVDPLVLDLDGDGLELTALVNGVGPQFDMDGDQFLEYTGWVAPDDGLLALDVDGNGTIDDINELFGGAGQSGFLALGAHDNNLDGVIDTQDTVFADLRVWRDLDRDGVTDEGELFSLSDLSISSIDLTSTDDGSQNALNTVARTGGFTYADGSTGLIGDIEFRINNYATTYTGDRTVSQVVQDTMPNLKGHGTLADLHVALTHEGTAGQLTATINSVLPTLNVVDFDILRERAGDILEAWTNAPPVPTGVGANPDVPVLMNRSDGGLEVLDFAVEVTEDVTQPDGSVVSMTFWRMAGSAEIRDAEGNLIDHPSFDDIMAHASTTPGVAWEVVSGAKLSFLERYLGENIPIDDHGSLSGAAITALGSLLETTERVTNQLTLRLAVQGGLKDYFPGVSYSVEDDTFVATTDRELVPMFEAIFAAAPADAGGAQDWINAWKPLIDTLLSDYDRPGASLVTKPFIFTNVVAAYETVGLPISLSDTAAALGVGTDVVDYGSGARTGTNDGEIFFMSSGNDTVESKSGGDVFVFGENFGQDVINDYEVSGDDFDVIRFAHLTPGEITATRDNLDLILTVNANGDSVRITGQFHEMAYSLFGGNVLPTEGIEEIVFADGSVWSLSDIAKAVSHPLSSDDTIIGTDHGDYLDGGAGDDYLSGGDNSDFYVFDTGYGHDRVEDNLDLILSSRIDIVLFGQGVLYDDMTFSRDGKSDDLIITLTSGDQLDIVGQFEKTYTGTLGSVSFDRIEYFNFGNSTQTDKSFTHDDIRQVLLQQAKTDGDDTIYGFSEEDRLDGGAGDDYLSGGNENDTYIFGLGYGHDTIHDQRENLYSGETDRVVFKNGISADSLVFERPFGSLDLNIYASDGSWLTIKDMFKIHYALGAFELDRIEEFHFTDDPSQNFNESDLRLRLLDSNSTTGDDIVEGFLTDDVLSGGAGNDTLYGLDGDDIYFFGYGFDHDTIIDFENNILATTNGDSIQFGEGITLESLKISRGEEYNSLKFELDSGTDTLEIRYHGQYPSIGNPLYQIENFIFAGDRTYSAAEIHAVYLQNAKTDGDDHIIGFASDDVLSGGLGNDRLEGREGADIYHWTPNSGDDVVFDETAQVLYDHENDKIVFGAGVTTSNLRASRSGNDLVLSVTGTTGSLTLEQFYYSIYHTVDWFEFTDGTILSASELSSLAMSGDDGDNTIVGGYFAETLNGGLGNDVLDGGEESDTYLYTLGDGNDTITEQTYSGTADTLQLTNGINSFDTSISRVYSDYSGLKLTFSDGGSIVLLGQGSHNPDTGIEVVNFSDGVTWTGQDLIQIYLQNTTLDQTFVGFTTSDTFQYARGDGNDTILEDVNSGGADRLVLNGIDPAEVTIQHSGSDVLLLVAESAPGANDGGSITLKNNLATHIDIGIEEVTFDDGTIWTKSDLENPTGDNIAPVANPDAVLIPNDGSPQPITSSVLLANDSDENDDTLTIVAVENAINATVSLNLAGDIEITPQVGFAGTATFDYTLSDGSLTSTASVTVTVKVVIDGTSGDDTISGTSDTDFLRGGLGNDTLNGQGGDDSYLYALGDGNDSIEDIWFNGTLDKLNFGAGILASEVTVSHSTSDIDDVTLHLSDGGSIVLDEQFYSPQYGSGVEQVVFADGTIWTHDEIGSAALANASTIGDDVISGFDNRNDTITGGLGNDTLNGQGGDDSYLYALGDGNDTIEEAWFEGTLDKLSFGAGILASEVTVSHSTSDIDDVTLHLSDGGSIVLDEQFYSPQYGSGVEQVVFADGTIWTHDEIGSAALANASTIGDDVISGFDKRNDTITGGLGNDTLNGQEGDDTYLYALGDGNDTIEEAWFKGTLDKLSFGAGILTSEVTVSHSTSDIDDVTLHLSDGGSIVLDEQFYSPQYGSGIEQVVFADGTIWTHDDIAVAALANGSTSGNDVISGFDNRDDTITGSSGDDILTGGAGNDIFRFNAGDTGHDEVTDFIVGAASDDALQFESAIFVDFAGVIAASTNTGSDTTITIDADTSILLKNVAVSALHQDDFMFV